MAVFALKELSPQTSFAGTASVPQCWTAQSHFCFTLKLHSLYFYGFVLLRMKGIRIFRHSILGTVKYNVD